MSHHPCLPTEFIFTLLVYQPMETQSREILSIHDSYHYLPYLCPALEEYPLYYKARLQHVKFPHHDK
jgi:hypothetical protein